MGLFLAKEIIRHHGGTIGVRSEGINKGSAFIVRLPLVKQSIIRFPRAVHEQNINEKPKSRKKILIVDDNRDAADSLAKLMTALGADAEAVYSGEEALAYVEQLVPDIFFLDISMPHMDGYELIALLRKKGIAKPIVALTGHGLKEDHKQTATAGFNEHLTKPIGVKELRPILGKY